MVIGLCFRRAAEFDKQPAVAIRQELDLRRMNALLDHVVDQIIVQPFKADGLVFKNLCDVIAGGVNVRVAQHQQRARRRAVNQAHSRFENRHAGAFAANQRAGDMKAFLRQQPRQVVTRHAARNVGEARANQVAVAVAQ